MQFQYEHNGELISVRLKKQADETYLATIGDTEYIVSARKLRDGTWLIDSDGQRVTAFTAKEGDNRFAQINGIQYQLEKSSGRRRTNQSAGAIGDLKAEMPGQVLDVRVTEGELVESGQVLVVLEAMKMEIRMTAPYAGTIAKLTVTQGDVVERGQVVVEVVPTEDS